MYLNQNIKFCDYMAYHRMLAADRALVFHKSQSSISLTGKHEQIDACCRIFGK